ncbi:MAG: ThuA domain-containing protein [Saprospiraceae bacterium]|nr:ThuA domain-containing protein [Saprospiraceae bacterium]
MLQPKINVLIIDGQNNHNNWKETTQIMRDQLISSGIFNVDVATAPPAGSGRMNEFMPDFSSYDVVVSNYNGEEWPESTKKDFETFVKSGHGFVSVHAADNAFANWKAYNEMIGLGGWEGRTEKDGPYVYYDDKGELIRDESPGPGGHHGKQHAFVIESRDTSHPIMDGLPHSWMHATDELYDQLRGPAVNMDVLATAYSDPSTGGTGRNEPMLMAIYYGLGRVFHTTLGHLNESQEDLGFEVTFLRGVEWAATGSVHQPVPESFKGE